jgi:hypothetical protein
VRWPGKDAVIPLPANTVLTISDPSSGRGVQIDNGDGEAAHPICSVPDPTSDPRIRAVHLRRQGTSEPIESEADSKGRLRFETLPLVGCIKESTDMLFADPSRR